MSGSFSEIVLYSDSAESSCLGGPTGTKKFLLLPIQGVIGSGRIMKENGTTPALIKKILEYAKKDKSIKGILLKINSPGGTVTDSDLIYYLIKDFARKKKIPVYSHIESIGASGAYYIAMSSTFINASPTSNVGSIGVIMSSFNVSGLLGKLGLKHRSITSGKNKDTLSPFRDLRPDEKEYLRTQILNAYERFLRIILKSRGKKLSETDLRKIADGKVYNADQARKLKLIDSVQYMEDFITTLKQKSKTKNIKIVTYLPETSQKINLYDISSPTGNIKDIIMRLFTSNGNGLYYYGEPVIKYLIF